MQRNNPAQEWRGRRRLVMTCAMGGSESEIGHLTWECMALRASIEVCVWAYCVFRREVPLCPRATPTPVGVCPLIERPESHGT